MILTYKNYIAKPEHDRYNLFQKVMITDKKTGTKREGEKVIGYGYRHDGLVRKLIRLEVGRKNGTVELKQLLSEIKTVLNQIRKEFTDD